MPPPWSELIQLARTDRPPPVNLSALLRVLHGVTPIDVTWRSEFADVFAHRAVWSGCAAAACALLAIAGWQAWVFWQDVLPWAQLLAEGGTGLGGAL